MRFAMPFHFLSFVDFPGDHDHAPVLLRVFAGGERQQLVAVPRRHAGVIQCPLSAGADVGVVFLRAVRLGEGVILKVMAGVDGRGEGEHDLIGLLPLQRLIDNPPVFLVKGLLLVLIERREHLSAVHVVPIDDHVVAAVGIAVFRDEQRARGGVFAIEVAVQVVILLAGPVHHGIVDDRPLNADPRHTVGILLYDWKAKGSPRVSSAEYNAFVRDAKSLFDRIIFEYCIGAWKGSGDSKMANHIKNWQERIQPMYDDSWKNLITSACNGAYNGQALDIKHLTPILCYQYALLKKMPENTLEETSEVDHIIPQAKLENNKMISSTYKDALFNLELLPKPDNNQKKDKTLNELTDSFLRQAISKYTGIQECDFGKYSDVSQIEELKKERLAYLLDAFGDKRKTELSN